MFEKIGCFDKYFFTYWEETDLCLKAHIQVIVWSTCLEQDFGIKVLHQTEGKVKSLLFHQKQIYFREEACNANTNFFVFYSISSVLISFSKVVNH